MAEPHHVPYRPPKRRPYRPDPVRDRWYTRAIVLVSVLAGIMSDLDLTSMQFAALVKLHELKAVSQTELGRLTGMDRATISGVVARLKRRNLVLYKPDPLDKRSRIIALTPAVSHAGRGSSVRKAGRSKS